VRGLGSYAWNGFVIGPHTMIQGVELLPAATYSIITRDGAVREQAPYWRLPGAGHENDQGVAHLRESLTTAISQHLLSDVPLGVFLSGGIDSSAVTALAVAAASGPVRTFNIAFDESEFDESAHARR